MLSGFMGGELRLAPGVHPFSSFLQALRDIVGGDGQWESFCRPRAKARTHRRGWVVPRAEANVIIWNFGQCAKPVGNG